MVRSHPVVTGRRLLVVLEPGDEVIGSIADACRVHGIRQAVITTFSGAFRSARLIAADHAPADPELPLPEQVDVTYTEGTGSGTVMTDGDELVVHIHVALGSKDRSAAAAAGHLLAAETHYVAEIVLDEVLTPALHRFAHPDASGLRILSFDDDSHPGAGGS